jgi:hypothetical protein
MPDRINPLEHPRILECKTTAYEVLAKLRRKAKLMHAIPPMILVDVGEGLNTIHMPLDVAKEWNRFSVRDNFRATVREAIATFDSPVQMVVEIGEAWMMRFYQSELEETMKATGLTMSQLQKHGTDELVEMGLGERVETVFIQAQNRHGGYVLSVRFERTKKRIVFTETLMEVGQYQGDFMPSYFRDVDMSDVEAASKA